MMNVCNEVKRSRASCIVIAAREQQPRALLALRSPIDEQSFDERAFVAHQRGKRLDLVLIHIRREPDATFHRLEMFGMH